jgi:RNase P subunit RPR2
MQTNEFLELTNKMTVNYGKGYSKEQLDILYQNLKHLSKEKYELVVNKIIQTSKFLPKLADLIAMDHDTKIEKKIEKTNCPICGGTGYVVYKKKVNDSYYDYGALCSCGNAKEYTNNGYYIPHIEDIEKR